MKRKPTCHEVNDDIDDVYMMTCNQVVQSACGVNMCQHSRNMTGVYAKVSFSQHAWKDW